MSQLDLSGFRKRKRGDKVFKFKVFGARGYPTAFDGSFQDNMRALLEFGHVENSVPGGMARWSFQLEAHRHPLLQLLLFVVEEPIELSLQFSCNHCRYIGWGNHMICNKNYHFLLPSKSGSEEYAKTSVIELQRENHSLHGVLHSNGFGHLLCINGSENGSGLPGYQIMELWDRLCSGLGAREVSLRDEAKKKGMELRLLHSVAYGRPWFGQWTYVCKRGSFGVSLEMYQNAIKTIQSIPLNLIAHQFGFGDQIQVIFSKYQLLSGNSLSTLGDLFNFMLELKTRVPKESSSSYPAIMSDASCRWSPKRVEKAIHVVVEALKRAEFQWVSRQHVRDVARAYIGDTGLLDFVLKSLGNHMVGKYLVRRCLNPVTKVLEYCLEDVSRTFSKQEVLPLGEAKFRPHHKVSWAQLIKDLLYMYNNILVDHNLITKNGAFGTIPLASRIILDAKHLAKDYHGEPTVANDETNRRKIYCKVTLKQNISEEATSSTARTTPYHCFLMRNNASFDELRFEVEKTFGETYFPLRNMAADSIRNMSPQGSDAIFKIVRPGTKLVFLCTQVGSEQGNEAMVVNCICGTKDDDGERMVSCDLCRVWQHTRQINRREEGGSKVQLKPQSSLSVSVCEMSAKVGEVVCVTGGSGFIGTWLVQLLLRRGYTVNATVKDLKDRRETEHLQALEGADESRLRLFQIELLDYDSIAAAVTGCAGVFHLASPCIIDRVDDPQRQLLDPAIKGTINVLTAAKKLGVRRVVVTSSISAITPSPNWPADRIKNEDCWADEEYCKQKEIWYPLSKTQAEKAAWKFAEENDLDVVVVNPGTVMGPLIGSMINASMHMLILLLKGGTELYEDFFMGSVHVKDVALAHVLVYENPSATGRHLCVEAISHYGDFAAKVAELHPEYKLPKLPKDTQPGLLRSKDGSKKLMDLGMKFIPMEQIIEDAIKSLREEKHIS